MPKRGRGGQLISGESGECNNDYELHLNERISLSNTGQKLASVVWPQHELAFWEGRP